jgi:hypothetical protein
MASQQSARPNEPGLEDDALMVAFALCLSK